jgi:hypothetical protein
MRTDRDPSKLAPAHPPLARLSLLSHDDFISYVAAHARLPGGASQAVSDVAFEILAALSPATRALVEAEVPVLRPARTTRAKPERIGHEIVSGICRVLADELSDEALSAVRHDLRTTLASWLERSDTERRAID